jgi:hypothetical protein
MERLVEMGGAEGRTVCVRDQFQVVIPDLICK